MTLACFALFFLSISFFKCHSLSQSCYILCLNFLQKSSNSPSPLFTPLPPETPYTNIHSILSQFVGDRQDVTPLKSYIWEYENVTEPLLPTKKTKKCSMRPQLYNRNHTYWVTWTEMMTCWTENHTQQQLKFMYYLIFCLIGIWHKDNKTLLSKYLHTVIMFYNANFIFNINTNIH